GLWMLRNVRSRVEQRGYSGRLVDEEEEFVTARGYES
ncbi:hypothetical protein Tco_1568523, partial [Tanacetum coccineum]